VARYLRRALGGNPAPLRLARLSQSGELRTSTRSRRWLSFTATQRVAPAAGEFTWTARVRLAPLVHLRVRDSLRDGEGSGEVRLWSAIPLASASGVPELDSGALHRYLAEAVWYPTALVPSASLVWRAMDERNAVATLTSHAKSVSLEFRFNEADEVADVFTPARWGRFDGRYRQVPWEGHFRNYQSRDGLLVPTEGEVGWYGRSAWQCVWRGRITAAVYERE
jgi:hypothetical protein